jgi:hypothetical protein
MDLRVTLMVDVLTEQTDSHVELLDPVAYAKQFVSLTPMVRGDHKTVVDDKIVDRLNVVDTEVVWQDTFVN